jgi:hypothetical protein
MLVLLMSVIRIVEGDPYGSMTAFGLDSIRTVSRCQRRNVTER